MAFTVKSDNSFKTTLSSKELNDAIHKKIPNAKHLSPNGHNLQKSKLAKKNRNTILLQIELNYAFSQIPLHKDTQKHCNFNIPGGNATGTFRFINGFYGLTEMPAIFHKAKDYTLNDIKSAHAFLDDIIIITTGSLNEHEQEIKKVLSRLDKENLTISLHKCMFAETEITWLGHKISPDGIIPTEKNTKAIAQMEQPHTLKQLRPFMGSMNDRSCFST